MIAEKDSGPGSVDGARIQRIPFPLGALQAALVGLIPPGVELRLEQYSGTEIELVNIEATPRGKGLGSTALGHLVKAADALDLDLMLLVAGPVGSEKYNRLIEFYGRFGFGLTDQAEIMRRPASIG